MDLVAFVLNSIIGVILVGATVGFLMQAEPPSAAVVTGVADVPVESPSVSPTPTPACAKSGEKCVGPTYAAPSG